MNSRLSITTLPSSVRDPVNPTNPVNPIRKKTTSHEGKPTSMLCHSNRFPAQSLASTALALLALSPMPVIADPAALLGSGNFTNGGAGTREATQYAVLNAALLRSCRLNEYPGTYFDVNKGVATPARLDAAVLQAHKFGVTPVILFEFYGSYSPGIAKYDWNAIGHAFADRFRPNSSWWTNQGIRDFGVSLFQAVNEPDGGKGLALQDYHDALKNLADGVHSVDKDLRVIPGGFMTANSASSYTLKGFGLAISDLLNDGTLDGIDLHTYNGRWAPVRPNRHSSQHDFDAIKKACNITRNIHFYTTEFNYQRSENEDGTAPDYDLGEDAAARFFLTSIWDQLGVVDADNHPVCKLALAWNLFDLTSKEKNYGLSIQLDPWEPTRRAQILRTVAELSSGMSFDSLDPRGTGVFVLSGNQRKLWVWQDRAHYSTITGTSFEVRGIRAGSTKLEVYGWDGPRASVALQGQASYTFHDLPGDETYMFLASSGAP